MVEVWKEIENHKGYMVSTKGNVKSLSFNRTGKEKVLTPCVDSKGYLFHDALTVNAKPLAAIDGNTFELNKEYYDKACNRIKLEMMQPILF